jgi:hypothetical protein
LDLIEHTPCGNWHHRSYGRAGARLFKKPEAI